MHTHVRVMVLGLLACHMLSVSVACGGNTANGWRMEFLGLKNQVDYQRQTVPSSMECDAEANTRFNKEANFCLSLSTSNHSNPPLLSLPLLFYLLS